MVNPAFLAGISSEVVDIYAVVEQDITADLARRIVKMGKISEASKWQIEKAQQFGYFQDGVAKTLARATGKSEKAIRRMMKEAGVQSLAYDNAVFRRAGLHPLALADSPALQAVLLQGTDTTLRLVGNLTRTTAGAANSTFQTYLDRAFMQVMTGAYDPQTAIHRAVMELARQGVTKVLYPGGTQTSIEAAVRRSVTTGVNQAVGKLQIANAREMGSQYVETTSHAGARPSHAVWQGRVFALWNPTKEYPDFYSETGYGTGEGLCGWHCYHNFYPFIPGISKQSFSRDPAADAGRDNDAEYEDQQRQRGYERQVRAAKLECVTLNAAMEAALSDGEKELYRADFERASVKLKRREAKLMEFLDSTGRSREAFREQVGGFNRSVSSKAVWANRKVS